MENEGIRDGVDEAEPCFIVQAGTTNIYIPKLMPLLKKGSMKVSTETITLKLDNAPKCKPSFNKKVKVRAYVKANKFKGISYSGLKKNARFLCVLVNKDPNRIFIDNRKM